MRLFYTLPRRNLRAVLSVSLLAAAVSIAGCNSTDNSTPDNSGSFTTNTVLSADSVVASTGTPATVIITLQRGGGYINGAEVTIDTLPTGVTAVFSPTVIAPGYTTSILTLTVGSTAALGTTALKIVTSGLNVAVDTTVLKLTVVTPAISLTAGATAATAPIGGAASIPLTFARVNGYTGSISLLAEGVPDNVTVTFTPALVTNGVTSSTLTLAPVAGATVGTSTVTVRAKGASGVADQTAPVQFSITSASASDYALSALPAALTLATGATTQTVIALNRTGGFVGNATFTVAGLPAGVTGTFTPNNTGGASSTLALSATAAAIPGRYNLIVTSTAVGGATKTLPLVLTVTVPAAVQVSLTPASLTIARLGVGQISVVVSRVGGVVGDVVLTTDGLPTGVTAAFAPATLSGTATTSLVTFSVASTATAGTYTVVIRSTGTSGTSGTATVTIIVGN